MNFENLLMFLQNDLANDFGFEDHIVIERLTDTIERFHRNRLNRPLAQSSEILSSVRLGEKVLELNNTDVWQMQNEKFHSPAESASHPPSSPTETSSRSTGMTLSTKVGLPIVLLPRAGDSATLKLERTCGEGAEDTSTQLEDHQKLNGDRRYLKQDATAYYHGQSAATSPILMSVKPLSGSLERSAHLPSKEVHAPRPASAAMDRSVWINRPGQDVALEGMIPVTVIPTTINKTILGPSSHASNPDYEQVIMRSPVKLRTGAVTHSKTRLPRVPLDSDGSSVEELDNVIVTPSLRSFQLVPRENEHFIISNRSPSNNIIYPTSTYSNDFVISNLSSSLYLRTKPRQ
ncbi:hypothetical protein Ciccas_004928 [Cichlidogyrus casuarinus]|uniref:Uncharacterized protein n=1 Tax=Cichlidogyrus casuarinus TaxID=1844966 RepID=A0ABD2QA35_9PLAT